MDSPITRITSADQLSKLNRLNPVTRGVGSGVDTPSAGSEKVGTPVSSTRGVDDQMFALEQHVPLAILQNPQLLKAEWAWKLLVLQQLTAALPAGTDDTAPGARGEGAPQTQHAGSPNGDGQANVSPGSTASALHAHTVSATTSIPAESSAGGSGVFGSGAVSEAKGSSQLFTGSGSSPESSTAPRLANSDATGTNPPTAGAGTRLSEHTEGAAFAPSSAPTGTDPGLLGMERAEIAVRKLWELLADTAARSDKPGDTVDLHLKTDPPLLPFASMNKETIALAQNKHDATRLQAWVMQDRMVAGVLDNPYERTGGGLFFPPPQVQQQDPPYQAVKWKAHRQTRIGAGGKLIHRIRLEMEVQGHALTCIVTAQRPQLFVHFVSDDTRLLSHLQRGEDVVSQPLRACGWELIGWTAGQGVHGEEVEL